MDDNNNDPSDTPPPYTTLSPPPYTFSLPPPTPSSPPSTPSQPAYTLRQFTWRLQIFFPLPSSSSSAAVDNSNYTVKRTWGANFSRSKPDLLITRTPPTNTTYPANTASELCATIRYARSGPLPWVPRAVVQYAQGDGEGGGGECTMALDRANARGWAVEIAGREHHWFLRTEWKELRKLVLVDEGGSVKARFVYSGIGMGATGGRDVGELRVFEGGEEGREWVEKVLCSCCAVLTYWRDEGKVLVNVGEGVG